VKSETFNCFSAKQIDLADYLAKLGYWPTKIRNNNYWYLSPFRDAMEKLSVFEGIFNFFSFQSQLQPNKNLFGDLSKKQGNFLAHNSLSFFEKPWKLMEKYHRIHLFLGTDTSGIRNTKMALAWSARYVDKSLRYKQYKDLNEWLIKSG
jgi:hypothetical protein